MEVLSQAWEKEMLRREQTGLAYGLDQALLVQSYFYRVVLASSNLSLDRSEWLTLGLWVFNHVLL